MGVLPLSPPHAPEAGRTGLRPIAGGVFAGQESRGTGLRTVRRLRLRLAGILVLRACLRFLFAWIMVWAGVVVALRAVLLVERGVLLWGLLGVAVAIVAGAFQGLRRLPSAAVLRASLDGHGALGGLLMTAGDLDIGAWSPRIERVPIPRLQWRSRRPWLLLASSVLFLGAAFLLPDRYLPVVERGLQLGSEVQKLSEQLQVLTQEQIVPPDKAEVLERDLQRASQEALARDPAKLLESIDHLEQSFGKAAAEAAEKAIQQAEFSGGAQALAEALQKAQSQMDAQQLSEAMKALGQMVDQAAAESRSLAEGLSEELLAACRQGNLSEAQLRELSEALRHCQACERGKLARLVEARLVDVAELGRCDQAGQSDQAALIDALGECKDSQQLAELLHACQGPGRGGISRGRGDAAMTWSQGVEAEDAAFKEKVLPPGAVASLKESRLAGISTADPRREQPGDGSSGGVLGTAQAGGGEARTQTILPEHGQTVRRYFERGHK